MSETRHRKRLAWLLDHWVPVALAVGLLEFLAVVGVGAWLGVLEVALPLEGGKTVPWPAVVIAVGAVLALGWAAKRLLRTSG